MENMALGLTTEAVSANLLQSLDMNINTQIMGNKYGIQCHAYNDTETNMPFNVLHVMIFSFFLTGEIQTSYV
jgi:hypothetical protein